MGSRVTNITEGGARRRRTWGVAVLLLALGAAAAMIALGVPRWWRVSLVVPFAVAGFGILQARDKTCVVLGAAGKREAEAGGYATMSAEECAIVERQMRSIVVRDVLFAVVATAVIWMI